MDDIRTVVWKELHEGLDRRTGSGRFGSLTTLLITLGSLGVLIPLSIGRRYPGVPAVGLAVAAAVLIVMSIVPDSFAGERDRRTLETLLASRLPARAILLGKIAAATIFAWGVATAVLVVSLVAVNVRDRAGLPTALELLGAVVAPPLAAWVMATFGVLLSLRASSVQAAQRAMALGLGAGALTVAALAAALPDSWKGRLSDLAHDLGDLPPAALMLIGLALLVGLNLLLLAVADVRFRRPKLVAP